jgi:predicted glutamine amidotransferase
MCLLSFYPDGVQPEADQLEIACLNNPDGFGYAIITKRGNLLIRRSMDADYLIDRLLEDRFRHRGPALFHARRGTSGTKTLSNCHPFHVGRDHRTIIAHNGVLWRPPATDPRSDTHIFAQEVMPVNFQCPDRPGVRRLLERKLGKNNKIVLLTTNRRYRRQYYIFNEALGHWTSDGAWMSNTSYQSRRASYSSSYSSNYRVRWLGKSSERSFDGGKTWVPVVKGGSKYGYCRFCREYQVVEPWTHICTVCRVCNDCGEWSRKCTCELEGVPG